MNEYKETIDRQQEEACELIFQKNKVIIYKAVSEYLLIGYDIR